jgi:hypothetical protein
VMYHFFLHVGTKREGEFKLMTSVLLGVILTD